MKKIITCFRIKSGPYASRVRKLIVAFEKTLIKDSLEFVIFRGDNNSNLGFTLTTCKLNILMM